MWSLRRSALIRGGERGILISSDCPLLILQAAHLVHGPFATKSFNWTSLLFSRRLSVKLELQHSQGIKRMLSMHAYAVITGMAKPYADSHSGSSRMLRICTRAQHQMLMLHNMT